MIPKKTRTRSALVTRARRLTAEVGLSGFTVQQLADDVGISRRTFFNHFPTKESAVLGIENGLDDALIAAFTTARRAEDADQRHLLDDLAELAIAHFEAMSPTASDLDDLLTAIQREPRLIQALILTGRAEQRRFVDLLVESDPSQDRAAAEVAAVAFEALTRLSVDLVLRGGDARPFAAILRERIALARTLFTDQASPASPPSTPQEQTA
ncbi:helix-turn-helix domain-containing protein [Frondihabitans peucedani]|uniref:TetR/AcrR family transcriptional regulator n=1 Tax=Frondihabitans peucedani TaxID=598626 RepID=A0ABP8E160_9MICO